MNRKPENVSCSYKLKFLTCSVRDSRGLLELNSPLKTSTKPCISQGGVRLQLGHHQMCPRLTNPEHGQPDCLLLAHSSAPSLHAAYCCSPTLALKAVTLRGDIWGRARVTCPTGARYFLEGMRSGKVEWVNVAQSHCEDSRTSSLTQLGINNFIKIFSGAQSKFSLPFYSCCKITSENWLRKSRFRNQEEPRISLHQGKRTASGTHTLQEETGYMSFKSRSRGSASPPVFFSGN